MPGVSEDQRGHRRDWSGWEQPTDPRKMWGRSCGTDPKSDQSSAEDWRRPRAAAGQSGGHGAGAGVRVSEATTGRAQPGAYESPCPHPVPALPHAVRPRASHLPSLGRYGDDGNANITDPCEDETSKSLTSPGLGAREKAEAKAQRRNCPLKDSAPPSLQAPGFSFLQRHLCL